MEASAASVIVFLAIVFGAGMFYGWDSLSTGNVVLLFIVFVPLWIALGMLWDWKKWRNK